MSFGSGSCPRKCRSQQNSRGRPSRSGPQILAHVQSWRQKHDARVGSAALSTSIGIPLQAASTRPPRHPRYRVAEASDCDPRARLLLAPSYKVQEGIDAEIENGLLAGQIQTQRIARQEGQNGSGANRLEGDNRLGMSNQRQPGPYKQVDSSIG